MRALHIAAIELAVFARFRTAIVVFARINAAAVACLVIGIDDVITAIARKRAVLRASALNE